MKKKIFLPVCHKEYWNKILIVAVILNVIPFIVKYIADNYLDVTLSDGVFNKIYIGIVVITLFIVIGLGIISYFHRKNRINNLKFTNNAYKVQGQILCVEKIVYNSSMSEEEKNMFKLYEKEEKEKYVFFGGNLGKKNRYRVKVKFFNNYKNDYDIVYSDWYDDYRWFSFNLEKFSAFLVYNKNNINEYYRNNVELIDVFYNDNQVVVGNFYRK